MTAETLGRYRIVKELGRGAMGRVLLAHDPRIDRPVAIKTVQIFDALPDADRTEARARFLREARAAGRLSHPAIVTVFDVGEKDGVPYLAMEYLEGERLDARVHPDRVLDPATVAELVARAAEALDYAHASGVIHRDIKPANLMRTGSSDVKILDFGLAENAAARLAGDGRLHGTPSYMSPEQIRGEELDGRSDLFSLGCVLYELLTGSKAFAGESVSSVIYRVVHERPGSPDARHERLPEALVAVVERALAKDRRDRFATGREFADVLRRAARDLSVEAAAPSPPPAAPGTAPAAAPASLPPARGRRKHSGAWLVVGMVAVIAAIAISAFVYTSILRDSGPSWLPTGWAGDAGDTSVEAPADVPVGRARVRTDPPGLAVQLDGRPIDGDEVEFPLEGPAAVLTASQACRTVERTLAAADVGAEIVLVPDPVEVVVVVDPGQAGAVVALNGEDERPAPVELRLDLCSDNRIDVRAPRHRPSQVLLPAEATPLEARTRIAAITLEPIPLGTVRLPRAPVPVTTTIDGTRVRASSGTVEIEEGSHTMRVVNREHWVDVTVRFDVVAGQNSVPLAAIPELAEIRVQSFPPNCRVSLRRGRGEWMFVATTPMTHRVAAGGYAVRVESPRGEVREQEVELGSGPNPPVRVSFAGGDR